MPGTVERSTLPDLLRRRARTTLDALESAVAGLGTAVLALAALLVTLLALVTSLVGVGIPVVSLAARGVAGGSARRRAGPDPAGLKWRTDPAGPRQPSHDHDLWSDAMRRRKVPHHRS